MALRGGGLARRLARALEFAAGIKQEQQHNIAARVVLASSTHPNDQTASFFAARGLITSGPPTAEWAAAAVAPTSGADAFAAARSALLAQQQHGWRSSSSPSSSLASLELAQLRQRRPAASLLLRGPTLSSSSSSWQQGGRRRRLLDDDAHRSNGSNNSSGVSSWLHTSSHPQQPDQKAAAVAPKPPPVPSADECDSAIATYDAAREQREQQQQMKRRQREGDQQAAARSSSSSSSSSHSSSSSLSSSSSGRSRPPSTYKTTSQRALELMRATLSGLVSAGRWLAGAPAKAASLARWSRSDWSTWWGKTKKVVKEEAHHYWVGTKLLAVEVRIASGLALRAARGDPLTRRERRQLTRTTADVFRLVPLLVVVLIPFMELALPLLLKIFPNMLPSTFEDKLRKEEEIKRRVQVKIEVARFLQDTVAQMASEIKARRSGSAAAASADELYRFMGRVRSGEPVDNSELIRFASLFSDELTLENLDRVQVVSLCQLLGLPPYGTDGFLRSRLRAQLAKTKKDDAVIAAEGLDKLEDDELRAALRARGMRGVYGEGAGSYMRAQLRGWLDLSLNHGLPSSLLLLSRAFALTGVSEEEAPSAAGAAPPTPVLRAEAAALSGVRETLLTLPEQVVQTAGHEAEVEGAVAGGGVGVGVAAGAHVDGGAGGRSAAATSSLAAAAAGDADGHAAAASLPPVASRAEALEKKLELVKKEQELIKKEREALDAEGAAAAKAAKAAEAAAHAAAAAAGSSSSAVAAGSAAAASSSAAKPPLELRLEGERGASAAAGLALKGLDDAAAAGATAEERAAAAAAAREARMRDILSALTVLASSSGVAKERRQFMELVRRELDRLAESVPESPSLLFTGGGLQSVRPEDQEDDEDIEDEEEEVGAAEAEAAAGAAAASPSSSSSSSEAAGSAAVDAAAAIIKKKKKAAARADRGDLALSRALEERVSGILHRIELELDEADVAIGGSMHVIDADGDGLISREELQQALRFLKGSLEPEDLDALLEALRVTTGGSGGEGEGASSSSGSQQQQESSIPVAELHRLAEGGDDRLLAAAQKAAAAMASKAAGKASKPEEVERIHTI